MHCTNCGNPYKEGDTFCIYCGTSLKQNFFLSSLKHPLFLTLCILITCGCGLTLMGDEFSVIGVLLTIFFWLTYASARKNVVSQTHLRSVSGTLFALYVINFMVFGGIALMGVLVTLLLSLGNAYSWMGVLEEYEGYVPLQDTVLDEITGSTMITLISVVILVIFIAIAVIGILLNILGFRKIHRFAQSVYLNVFSDNPLLYKPGSVSTWMIVFGIFLGVSALDNIEENFILFLGNGAYSAAFFVGSAWIRKHFTR